MKKIALIAGLSAASLAIAGCAEPASEDEGYAASDAVAEEATAEEDASEDAMAEETSGEEAPDVEGMDDGDRGNDTGRRTDD
jgi:hypothetical protein